MLFRSAAGVMHGVSPPATTGQTETYTVDQDADEGGVKTVLRGECGDLADSQTTAVKADDKRTYHRVRHALGDNDNTDSKARDYIAV